MLSPLVPLAGLLKKTAGLVGLAVCQSLHQRLRILHTRILEQIPKNAAYRTSTEQITSEKLGMVIAERDVKKSENQLQGGRTGEVFFRLKMD